MNLGGIAVSAFGGALQDVKGKEPATDVRAIFKQDSFVRYKFENSI